MTNIDPIAPPDCWIGELLGKKLWEWWGFCIFVD